MNTTHRGTLVLLLLCLCVERGTAQTSVTSTTEVYNTTSRNTTTEQNITHEKYNITNEQYTTIQDFNTTTHDDTIGCPKVKIFSLGLCGEPCIKDTDCDIGMKCCPDSCVPKACKKIEIEAVPESKPEENTKPTSLGEEQEKLNADTS